jgi:hypothetical protein
MGHIIGLPQQPLATARNHALVDFFIGGYKAVFLNHNAEQNHRNFLSLNVTKGFK